MHLQIVIIPVNDYYVISDDGAVSKAMGVEPPVPWHLVAPNRDAIGSRVQQMESLLGKVLPQKGRIAAGMATNNGEAMRKLIETPVPLGFPSPRGNGNPKLTLDDLGLDKRQLWRLEKAVGSKDVSRLVGMTEEQLSAQKGIGPAIVEAVKKGLKKHKLRLSAAV